MSEWQKINGLLNLALQAFENIDDAVITYDDTGNITSWNRAAEIIYEISHDDALSQKIDWLLEIEDESVTHEEIRREVRRNGSWRGELRQLSTSGKRVWVDWSIALLVFPDLGPVGMISITKDITERKNVEERLRQSEARYRLLADNSNDVIWVRDLEFRNLYISPSVENQLGYTVEEAMELRPERLLTPDSLNLAVRLLEQALEGRKDRHIFEMEHIHKDGRRLWVEINTRLLYDDDGNPTSLIGVSRDITKRRRAENLLRLQRDLALMLGEPLSFEKMIRQCLAIAIESGQMDCGAIFLMDEHDEDLLLADSLGNSRAFIEDLHHHTGIPGIIQEVIAEGKPRYDMFFAFNLPIRTTARETKLRATAVLPLVYRERVIGSLSVASYSKNEIPDFIRQALEAIASQIAASIARKSAEDRVRRSEDRLRAYIEAIPDLSIVLDREGRFVEIVSNENNPHLRIFKRAKGTYLRDYFTPDNERKFLEVIEKTLETGISQRYEYPIAISGHTLWFEATTSVLHYAFGEERQVLWMARETTERHEADIALRRSEQRIQALLNAPVDSAILLDREGMIQALNDVAARKLDGTVEELKNRCLFDFLPEPLRSDRRKKYEAVFSSKKPLRFEDSYAESVFDNSVYPVFGEDNLVAALAVFTRDITHIRSVENEKRRMEAQLRHQQKLESIGTLAAGVAHEINNPINIIMNYGELILDEVEEDGIVGEYSREIISEGGRISEIVRNLLAFSRQEQEFSASVHPKDIIDATLSLVGKVFQKDNIDLQAEVEPDLPMISCNRQQMMQVLMNLLTNARDALNQRFKELHPEKKVILRARQLQEGERKIVRIEVEDRGVGMTPQLMERIFDPFFTTKSRANGTGLGLSISHGIMREHEGRLTCTSQPGRGSIFSMELNAES